jgi:hypothetical protein
LGVVSAPVVLVARLGIAMQWPSGTEIEDENVFLKKGKRQFNEGNNR